MILEIGVSVTWPEDRKLIWVHGSPLDVLQDLREQVRKYGNYDIWLSWANSAGGMEIPAGRSLDDEIRLAYEELQDPDLCFDDPYEEDMAREIVGALHCALLVDKAELVIDDGDHSEDAGARYDRYDELEGPETYN